MPMPKGKRIAERVTKVCGVCSAEFEILASKAALGKGKFCSVTCQSADFGKRSKRHGHWSGAASPTYRSWISMKTRCENPNAAMFRHYGGRGIAICDRWQSFGNFLADMGERPVGTSIDRIDNSLGYTPENCRWSNARTQNQNRTITRLVEWQGEEVCVTELARRLGLTQRSLFARINNGWPKDRWADPPTDRSKRRGLNLRAPGPTPERAQSHAPQSA